MIALRSQKKLQARYWIATTNSGCGVNSTSTASSKKTPGEILDCDLFPRAGKDCFGSKFSSKKTPGEILDCDTDCNQVLLPRSMSKKTPGEILDCDNHIFFVHAYPRIDCRVKKNSRRDTGLRLGVGILQHSKVYPVKKNSRRDTGLRLCARARDSTDHSLMVKKNSRRDTGLRQALPLHQPGVRPHRKSKKTPGEILDCDTAL